MWYRILKGKDTDIAYHYFRIFRQNFKQSTFIWLFILLIELLLYVNYCLWGYSSLFSEYSLLLVLPFLFVIILFMSVVFPYIGLFKDNLKNSLGHNFPVYDKLETKNGVTIATSTKARDITQKTYNSVEYKNGLYNRIKGDIDDILGFESAKMKNGKTLNKDMIDKKILEISINEHELTKQQIDNIKRELLTLLNVLS